MITSRTHIVISIKIFHVQIYQLMKMDCYPRFKKSELVKECLLAEMTGKPLPIETAPQQKQTESQYTGIWKKHRVGGAYYAHTETL